MEKFNLLSLDELVEINGGEKKRFWDTFGGKLVFALCAAVVGWAVKEGLDELTS